MKYVRIRIAVAVVALISSMGLANAVQAQTPVPGRTETVTNVSDVAIETLYAEDAPEATADDGVTHGWIPVSTRYIDTEDGLTLLLELRNATGSDQLAPDVAIELSVDGSSYGRHRPTRMNLWVPAGESAFYASSNVYKGSVALGEWDSEAISVEANTTQDLAFQSPVGLEFSGDRVTNNRERAVGRIAFTGIVRDVDGIYAGSCRQDFTGANIPAGRSIKLSYSLTDDRRITCGFTDAGELAISALKHDGPTTQTLILAAIDEP